MKKLVVYIPIIGMIAGIYLMLNDEIYYSLGIYIISILIIILIIIFGHLSLETKNILQSLILLPVLQIINFSVPQFFTIIYLRYILVYAIMGIPIYSIIRNLYSSSKDFGINFRIYLPIIILIGTIVTMIIQYIDIISGTYTITLENIFMGEKLATIFLIMILLISVFVSDTKYWNKYNSNTLDMCSDPMLIIFMMTIANNILTIIYA